MDSDLVLYLNLFNFLIFMYHINSKIKRKHYHHTEKYMHFVKSGDYWRYLSNFVFTKDLIGLN